MQASKPILPEKKKNLQTKKKKKKVTGTVCMVWALRSCGQNKINRGSVGAILHNGK